MQRRAAAVSAVALLVVAAGAYAFIGFAQEPEVSVEATHELGTGDDVTVDGRTYTATSVGGGSATLEWTNESAVGTATLANNSTVDYARGEYRVLVPDAENPEWFDLEEVQNVTRILRNDSRVENQVLRDEDGTKYVRYTNGSTERLDSYLPAPNTERVSVGDEFDYHEENVTATVAEVRETEVLLRWETSVTNDVSASQGANVTLNGQTFLAHFPDDSTLVLSDDFADYRSDRQAVAYYEERIDGLWGVTILSTLAAVLLIAMAYLPSRY